MVKCIYGQIITINRVRPWTSLFVLTVELNRNATLFCRKPDLTYYQIEKCKVPNNYKFIDNEYNIEGYVVLNIIQYITNIAPAYSLTDDQDCRDYLCKSKGCDIKEPLPCIITEAYVYPDIQTTMEGYGQVIVTNPATFNNTRISYSVTNGNPNLLYLFTSAVSEETYQYKYKDCMYYRTKSTDDQQLYDLYTLASIGTYKLELLMNLYNPDIDYDYILSVSLLQSDSDTAIIQSVPPIVNIRVIGDIHDTQNFVKTTFIINNNIQFLSFKIGVAITKPSAGGTLNGYIGYRNIKITKIN